MPNKEFFLPIFTPGKQVKLYTGEQLTVDHVHIRGSMLTVKVKEKNDLIPAHCFVLDPTEFRINQR